MRLPQHHALLWILSLNRALCSVPRQVTWSDKQFGPDGPWQAVTVSMGSNYTELVVPSSEVALYPGGSWESRILLSSICDNKTLSSVCYGDIAGLFDSDISVTLDNTSIETAPDGNWGDLSWGYTDAVPVYARATRAIDWMTIDGSAVPEVDLITIAGGWQTYPGGQAYPLEVGILSLGSPDINQTFGAVIKINATFITSYFYDQSGSLEIPSYSYGMHIGSAPLGIPGSLLLGGYDQNRVMGDVSAQAFSSGSFPIELFDLGIGVAEGGSPWNYSNKSGLLAQGNSSLASGLRVIVDPANPYLYLPQSACDALAAELPVTYQPDYGLYFWNTSDPQFDAIVTSPSYLAFRFGKNNLNNEYITIKAPFALLNLTLQAPLVETPTQYFPCMATNSTPALGRAFLQAAFVGVNWFGGKWFLAQAPGPDGSFIVDTVTIGDNDSTISGSTNSWEDTWQNTWKVLATRSTNSTTSNTSTPQPTTSSTPTKTNNVLSPVVKIGIIIGSTVGGVLIISLLSALCIRRRRQRRDTAIRDQNQISETQMHQGPGSLTHQLVPVEAPDSIWDQRNELHSQERYEMGAERGPFFELEPGKGGGREAVFELPGRMSGVSLNVI
ncbi:aspartic protease [Aspergillus heteromorphus CBS 117.55]|uniref:Aspartic protease n=1 Tax=Aspergillus heteromorphus CBS 117.55 TaxID=1448321 RepID=A0A317VP66_9EURO|nr:aspartic protease [Aspergillus heteromorphus CBS 117.55]PWY75051.1 aspartic protease [Aspergillus heteromorphus CBS 117.55]